MSHDLTSALTQDTFSCPHCSGQAYHEYRRGRNATLRCFANCNDCNKTWVEHYWLVDAVFPQEEQHQEVASSPVASSKKTR